VEELPSSSKYPSTALLHAICASASLYSSFIEPEPRPEYYSRPAYEVHVNFEHLEMERGEAPSKRGAFAVQQSALAKAIIEFDISNGHKILDAARAAVILCWYHVSCSFVKPYMTSSQIMLPLFPPQYANAQYAMFNTV
jgi:hypothetical protein